MRSVDDIAARIAREPGMMALLEAVARLRLPDGWIGAGFVRNAVWDVLHGRAPDCARLDDVDVVFFDRAAAERPHEQAIERVLAQACPGVPWSARNQARMHIRNADAPYADTAAAIARWPETATAIAARLAGGRVELLAPHGVGDLLGLVVRPTPAFVARPAVFEARLRAKDWFVRWPRLTRMAPCAAALSQE
ncbi:nucleotidyltransferase family protein [Bradyrhizobium sp. U87765 SZCCT0131]|uniref:nucleotidyltransferase family protein n=1 Tax=unclassified Bradyrhizobium TaxID=2631580 RepID=UPI001BAB3564|nr:MULTISPECIES: nucleotidyltransferase family protein [unclassified Bradyrhizobium]MBR1222303.1 nucleotidyltransferase family protein [Bradyrhizobium sp. U87765 SZCCT0131]MBR1264213.1 nucleotidyltransferase family protein [Bradyrhizobium sp. U87765 SZCCT0134]MBR1308004.1 nucleotidyltransferase family protein [Bradyrhizobium sp. U87765 SZCCT0110]MBR1320463.1 nucleotidyltransferase family protein [Bradyrhizobium sp. U87765 SZCCT0109]MBR1348424.1 nucleotidyltransferase family protein [Bradyrhizo